MTGELQATAHETVVVSPDRVTVRVRLGNACKHRGCRRPASREPYRSKRPIGLFRPFASFEVLRRGRSNRRSR
jgi:hypothetical protein